MERVIILGPGGSGKSTLAARIGAITSLPVIGLDKIFWQANLTPTPSDKWLAIQQQLAKADRWIIEGDLGPYDAVEGRFPAADAIIFLDSSVVRCAWRALWRSCERMDFWLWLLRTLGFSVRFFCARSLGTPQTRRSFYYAIQLR